MSKPTQKKNEKLSSVRKIYSKEKNKKAPVKIVVGPDGNRIAVRKAPVGPAKKVFLTLPKNEAYHAAALSAVMKIKRFHNLDVAVASDPYGIWKLSRMGTDCDLSSFGIKFERIKVTIPELIEENYATLEKSIQAMHSAQLQGSLMNERKDIVVDAPQLDITSAVHLLLWKDIVGSFPSYDVNKETLPMWPLERKRYDLPKSKYFVTYGTLPDRLESALEIYSDRRVSPKTLEELLNVSQNSRCTRVLIDVDSPAITALIGTGIIPIPIHCHESNNRYVPRALGIAKVDVGSSEPEAIHTVLEALKL